MSPRDLALQLKSNLKPKSGVLHAPELITGKSLMSVMGSMRPGLAMQPNPVGLARSYAKLLGATVDLFA